MKQPRKLKDDKKQKKLKNRVNKKLDLDYKTWAKSQWAATIMYFLLITTVVTRSYAHVKIGNLRITLFMIVFLGAITYLQGIVYGLIIDMDIIDLKQILLIVGVIIPADLLALFMLGRVMPFLTLYWKSYLIVLAVYMAYAICVYTVINTQIFEKHYFTEEECLELGLPYK